MRYTFLRFSLFIMFMLVSLEANSEQSGLTYLNSIREKSGLIKLKSNKALQNAAASHARYLIQNQRNGHYETKGNEAYTGSTPSDRVIQAGYPSTFVMENVSINTLGQKKSIDNLFSAIYHRLVFLNFDTDEIGYGSSSTKKKRQVKQAYVYNMGTSGIAALCQKSFTLTNGTYYMRDNCKQSTKMVPQSLFEAAKDKVRSKNREIILYPYAEQTDIWPAFYNESPDPLPGYKVSGFPISVQFNPANYSHVRLKDFRLYDANGKEIKETKILQHNSDPNHILSELEFVLMPLKRLEFNTRYSAVFEGVADGTKVKKQWRFRTAKPEEKIYRVSENRTTLAVKAGSTALLYMVPVSRKDILHSYRSRGGIKASFMDQNTLRVTFPKRRSSGRVSLDFGKQKVFFDVE
ncbi:CAP domain-containing protein [Sulfurovum sp. XGS-02]|uniref:CAP domain-containing protein n=1 Tax=Sulfurovum sp. XGS-02 TaxID=2925411 RepID=UPI002053AB8D|nr:CAP domain-containing protein [Sulfurovum sp. XGS-02]UPT78379.1 CAP domain-containing protein [Sulfurovum sp. XGS-02]